MTERTLALVHTERLALRQPVQSDVDAAIAIESDPQTNRYNPSPFTPAQAREMFEKWQADWHTHGIGYWAVRTQADLNTVIGFGGIRHKIMDDVPSLNLYFRFAPAAWGHGYAAETARAALTAAFEVLHAPHVRALVRPANAPSIKTLERAGLRLLRPMQDAGGGEQLLYEITPTFFFNETASRP
ncbi:MAG: GNAT family N-acetyltransferase [Burkholderiaceae bacterium]